MRKVWPVVLCVGVIGTLLGGYAYENCITSSFYETRQCAVDALSRPNQVFHAIESARRQTGETWQEEVWYDGENNIARRQERGKTSIFHDGWEAHLDGEERLVEEDMGIAGLRQGAAVSLKHIAVMFQPDAWRGDANVLNGEEEAYRIHLTRQWHGDWTGRQTYEVYLDKDCLPTHVVEKIEEAGPESEVIETRITYDFISRSNLPPDFVSLRVITDQAVPPVGFLQQALDKGINPYWLGETFESMRLIDVRADRQRTLVLTYSEEGHGRRGWTEPGLLIEMVAEKPEICPSMPATWQEVPVIGTTATLCYGDGTDRGLRGDQWAELLVSIEGGYLRVWPGYGDVGTNPYRGPEGMRRLAAALRPFEGHTQ
jgi:hypothetical protein